MFKLSTSDKLSVKVKGLFNLKPIQWEDRLKGRAWRSYEGSFEPQRWGIWDSESCWAISATNSIEDQLELLYADNQFSQEAKDFFHNNGYIDEVGDFSISERFIEILGGQKIQGGTSPMAWQTVQKYGLLPRKLLTYSIEQSNKWNTEDAFVNDYFNLNAITPTLLALAKQCQAYINIAYQKVSKDWVTPSNEILTKALQFAPVCIGIPVPANVLNWNSTFVQYDGGKIPAHEVELQDVDTTGYLISDQYEPDHKTLSHDYYLIFATQGIVYSLSKPLQAPPPIVLTPEQSFLQKLWSNVYNWFNGIPTNGPLG